MMIGVGGYFLPHFCERHLSGLVMLYSVHHFTVDCFWSTSFYKIFYGLLA